MIAYNPNGDVFILEEKNPFSSLPDIESNKDTLTEAMEFQKLSQLVRIITLVDFTFTTISLIHSDPRLLGFSLISLFGYLGAVNYNKIFVNIYLIFQYLKAVSKIYVFYITFYTPLYTLMIVFSQMYDVYVICIVHKFLKNMNNQLNF